MYLFDTNSRTVDVTKGPFAQNVIKIGCVSSIELLFRVEKNHVKMHIIFTDANSYVSEPELALFTQLMWPAKQDH